MKRDELDSIKKEVDDPLALDAINKLESDNNLLRNGMNVLFKELGKDVNTDSQLTTGMTIQEDLLIQRMENAQLKKELEILRSKVSELTTENESLAKRVCELQSDLSKYKDKKDKARKKTPNWCSHLCPYFVIHTDIAQCYGQKNAPYVKVGDKCCYSK